ncbi:MAG TPA: NAD(P)-dependent oxidoreductase [Candidatus Baltobacteraceae bacterium]|nr:NAD(P)-dependent oxidoreductase [Candidatus Baltobacteraceae bacterium]
MECLVLLHAFQRNVHAHCSPQRGSRQASARAADSTRTSPKHGRMASTQRIGIVGTGRMGSNIARRLKDVGYAIAALYDVQREAAEQTAHDTGGEVCEALARVTELSDVIITVVSDDAAMYRIFSEEGDSLLTGAQGKYFMNTATVTPNVHVEVQRRCEERRAHSIEACMASSIPQARNGTLYLMCGGRREAFEHVRPMLEQMSSSLRYVGEAGRAAQVKALVNMVMNINTAGLAEGLGLADALGLDLDMVREVFSQTGANSRVLETDGADMQNRDHDCYFSAEHAAKDSGIALSLAHDCDLRLPLAQATFDQYERMKTRGLGALDKSGVSELTFKSRRRT